LTLGDLVDHFREDPENKRLRYFDSLELLLAWWVNGYGTVRLLEVNVLMLRSARERLGHGRKPATVNRYLSAMRSAWNWGRSAGLIPQDHPWPQRLMLTEDNERQRYLELDELNGLMDAARKHSRVMHAAVVTSVGCGLRQGELLRLTWADVDLKKQQLRILRTKNDEPRSVWAPQSVCDALKTLKRGKVVGTAHVFLTERGEPLDKGTLRHRWLQVRDVAGLADFRWHDLRHSCASFLAQQGASLLEIGSVLGHRSSSVTRRYAHLVEGAPVTGQDKLDSVLGGGH
jgi:integrase